MVVMRLAIVTLLLLPALGLGQTKQEDEDKVSNDNPARPLQMPPASTEVKEAIDDFERFSDAARGSALQGALHHPRGPGLPVRRRRERLHHPGRTEAPAVLTGLPPHGQAAYRLFYDAEARKLFDEAEGPTELKTLERHLLGLFHHVGRRQRRRPAGRSLLRAGAVRSRGRLLAGDLARAPRHRSVARLALGEGCAWRSIRAGRQSEFEQIRAELPNRYSDEKVTLGGQTAAPAELLRRLLAEEQLRGRRQPKPAPRFRRAGSAISPDGRPGLADAVRRIGRSRHDPPELTQWESNSLSAAVPAVTVDGSKLVRQLSGPYLRARLEERQDALAVGGVSPPRSSGHAERRPDASTRAGSRSSPRANTSGAWPAT